MAPALILPDTRPAQATRRSNRCLDIKNFYLTAALDYYEYMKIPLDLFPEWIKKPMQETVLHFWKYDEQYGDSLKQEF